MTATAALGSFVSGSQSAIAATKDRLDAQQFKRGILEQIKEAERIRKLQEEAIDLNASLSNDIAGLNAIHAGFFEDELPNFSSRVRNLQGGKDVEVIDNSPSFITIALVGALVLLVSVNSTRI